MSGVNEVNEKLENQKMNTITAGASSVAGHGGHALRSRRHAGIAANQAAPGGPRVSRETSEQTGIGYAKQGVLLIAREVVKVSASVAATLLGEWAFCRSDVPLPKGDHFPNFFQEEPKGFQFTGFWVGATACSKLVQEAPAQVASAAYAWWNEGTLPHYMSAVRAIPGFFFSLAVDFISSAGSAHFSLVVPYGKEGSMRLMKYVVVDEKVGLKRIFWATKVLSVLANHASELPNACKSIWNRDVSVSQGIAKFSQCAAELMQSVFLTKTYAEGILIHVPKEGEMGRYSYLLDGLTLANGVMSAFAAGCAKVAGNWNDKQFKGYSLWQYLCHQIDSNFLINQITVIAGLMLTAAGTLQASSIYNDGTYDITDIGYACQFYFMAIVVGAYVNPLLKYFYARNFAQYFISVDHAHAA